MLGDTILEGINCFAFLNIRNLISYSFPGFPKFSLIYKVFALKEKGQKRPLSSLIYLHLVKWKQILMNSIHSLHHNCVILIASSYNLPAKSSQQQLPRYIMYLFLTSDTDAQYIYCVRERSSHMIQRISPTMRKFGESESDPELIKDLRVKHVISSESLYQKSHVDRYLKCYSPWA